MKYHLITLGCPKNKVDSDGIEMLLRDAAYKPTEVPRDADVLIVNTCGFLEAAKEESIGVLQDLGKRKRKHQMLIAAGCLVQRNGAEVLERVPKVDGLLGTRRWMEVLELIQQVRGGKSQRRFAQYDVLGDLPALRPQPVVRAAECACPARRPAGDLRPGHAAAAGAGRQRLSQDLRRLQRALCLLHDPQLQGQAAQSARSMPSSTKPRRWSPPAPASW